MRVRSSVYIVFTIIIYRHYQRISPDYHFITNNKVVINNNNNVFRLVRATVGLNVTSRISPFGLPIEKLARAELVSRLLRRLHLLRRQHSLIVSHVRKNNFRDVRDL